MAKQAYPNLFLVWQVLLLSAATAEKPEIMATTCASPSKRGHLPCASYPQRQVLEEVASSATHSESAVQAVTPAEALTGAVAAQAKLLALAVAKPDLQLGARPTGIMYAVGSPVSPVNILMHTPWSHKEVFSHSSSDEQAMPSSIWGVHWLEALEQ